MEELAVVAFGCLLHDIGKIVQRADDTPLRHGHARFGADLLQSAGLLKESKFWYHIFECVRYHHWKYIKDGSATMPAARIAFEANALVSDTSTGAVCDAEGFNLEEVDYGPDAHWDRHKRLESIFTLLHSGKEQLKAYLPMSFAEGRKPSLTRGPGPEDSGIEEKAPDCYSHLRDLAISRVVAYLQGRDPRSTDLVNDVSTYLEAHLRFVPAECCTERPCYISLYDHLRLTSALGSCIFAWLLDRHPDFISGENKSYDFESAKTEPVFLLIFAELHGVRKAILEAGDGTNKRRMRARTLYAELLRQWCAEQVLRTIGLTRNNLLLSSGNKFAILAPNTPMVLATLARMQARLNEWLHEKFAGRLYVALDCSEATAKDIQQTPADKSNNRSVLRAGREKLQKIANEPFRGLLATLFEPQKVAGACTECGADIVDANIKEQASTCALCRAAAETESTGEDLLAMVARPHQIQASIGSGYFPVWDAESSKFVSGSLRLSPEAESSLSAGIQAASRQQKTTKTRDTVPFGVLRARVVFPGGGAEPGPSGPRRNFVKDWLIEKSMERFFESQMEELFSDKDSRQFDSIEKLICSVPELMFSGPADKLIDFAIQLQQRLYKFTSGMVTLTCGIATSRQQINAARFAQVIARAEELDATTNSGLTVDFDFGGRPGVTFSLSWHDWRREVRPLLHDIQRLRARSSGAFWNELLEFTLRNNVSFYRLLYAVARMDERSAELRNDGIWQRFKRQRIVAMGSRGADVRLKQILAATLLWIELSSTTVHKAQSTKIAKESQEPGEQNAEPLNLQPEPESSPVGGA